MDALLGTVTKQAMNYAIRSGVTLTASYAIKQSTKLLQNAPKSQAKDDFASVHQRLQHKIRIVSPAIDMIELIAARGNTSLESAMLLTKELRLEIQDIGERIASLNHRSEQSSNVSSRKKAAFEAENEQELALLAYETKQLIARIDDAIPLINLALTTSGAKLSTTLPSSISPSRLLQASTLLTAGDGQYAMNPNSLAQIGPEFILTVYMLFSGHHRPENEEEMRNTMWKEVIHKARVRLRRVPLDVVHTTGSGSDALPSTEITSPARVPKSGTDGSQRANTRAEEYAYQMMIIEDYNDGRHHDWDSEEGRPTSFDDVQLAGIREMIPVHEISKIFYADTSKVLNIGTDNETNHPVLLLRRDVNAPPPRRMIEREAVEKDFDEQNAGEGARDETKDDGRPKTQKEKQYVEEDASDRKRDPFRLPSSLDPEWIAFEVYQEDEESDDEDEFEDAPDEPVASSTSGMSSNKLAVSFSGMQISGDTPVKGAGSVVSNVHSSDKPPQPWTPQIKTSLSMLELLLRLTSLQQFQQQSHLSITDELLNFFLEESSSTGAGGDESHRQAVRADARKRVGFDPYNESPVKRRGEDYLDREGHFQGPSPYSQTYQGYQASQSSTPYTRNDYHGTTPSRTPLDSAGPKNARNLAHTGLLQATQPQDSLSPTQPRDGLPPTQQTMTSSPHKDILTTTKSMFQPPIAVASGSSSSSSIAPQNTVNAAVRINPHSPTVSASSSEVQRHNILISNSSSAWLKRQGEESRSWATYSQPTTDKSTGNNENVEKVMSRPTQGWLASRGLSGQ